MMKNFELNNEKTFNSEAWNYFQTFDSKRTDKNYVCDWIDSREIISSIDQEEKAWGVFIKSIEEEKKAQMGVQASELVQMPSETVMGKVIHSTVPHD